MHSSNRPPLYLMERQTVERRLHPCEIEYLLEHHRDHLSFAPTRQRHVWRITTGGHVGVLHTPLRRIIVSAKIPLVNLLYLIDPDTDPKLIRDPATPGQGQEVLDLFALLLAQRMQQRAAAGLHRAYRQRHASGQVLLGRLDLPTQLRQAPGRHNQLHCQFDDLTDELPCHLIPRRLATVLARSSLISDAVQAQLRQALSGFAHLPDESLDVQAVEQLRRQPLPSEYQSLREVCLLLAEQLAPDSADRRQSSGLLLSLERLFERFLGRLLQQTFREQDEVTVSLQRDFTAGDLTLRPDVSIERNGGSIVVIDAKWKRLGQTPNPEDLYQALSYAVLLGGRTAMLIYPGGRRRSWCHAAPCGRTVEARTLRVTGSLEQCRRSARRLGREIRQLVRR